MNLETKITIYNFTPSGFYVDPQLALAYPLDFLEAKKVQRFSFVFADSQYFAWSDLEQYDLTLYH